MNRIFKTLATTLAIASVAAAGVLTAGGAAYAETPGCAGTPGNPLTYVCIDVKPANAVPTVAGMSDVVVPMVCVFGLSCTSDFTVSVANLDFPSEYVMRITWNGYSAEVSLGTASPDTGGLAALGSDIAAAIAHQINTWTWYEEPTP